MDKRWIVYLPSFFSGIYISVDTMRCFFSCRGRRWSAECCWNKLLMLLVFIFFCREQCWRSGIVVSVVVNIITLVFSYSVNSYIVPFFLFLFRISFGVMMPSFNTLFIVQMTNQKQGQQGRLGQHFFLSRPRTCADESIESAVFAVPC